MATLNTIYSIAPNKGLFIEPTTNQFIVSGYQMVLDPSLNANISISSIPSNPNAAGLKGSIAFDKNYIYYCNQNNQWSRGRLTSEWANISSISPLGITNPNYYWYLTINNLAILGGRDLYAPSSISYNANGAFTSGTFGNGLIDPNAFVRPGYTKAMLFYGLPEGIKPDKFSISFETKRVNSDGFLLGSKYGELGFHFEFSGNYLNFKMPKGNVNGDFLNDWYSIKSVDQFNNSSHYQVVGTFDNTTMRYYINGAFQGSLNIGTQTISQFNAGYLFGATSAAAGLAIGGTSLSNVSGNPNGFIAENNKVIVRNVGLWNGAALSQTEISALYNGGSFRKYPFV